MTQEETLLSDITSLKQEGDYEALKEKIAELIAHQKTLPITGFTDEQLAEIGVDMILLAKERELAENIKQAEQDGDFVSANQYRRELIIVQHKQPRIREI
jgi:hypothetical protein